MTVHIEIVLTLTLEQSAVMIGRIGGLPLKSCRNYGSSLVDGQLTLFKVWSAPAAGRQPLFLLSSAFAFTSQPTLPTHCSFNLSAINRYVNRPPSLLSSCQLFCQPP
jgi:hypothetical protein